MCPTIAFPLATPLTDQIRALFVVPVTVAVNCWVLCTITFTLAGVTVTLIPDEVVVVDFEGLRLQPVRPTVTTAMHRNGVQRVFISIPSPT